MVARQLSLRGLQALEQQRWDSARQLFEQAIEVAPSDERAHCGFARSLRQSGQGDRAIVHMEESVRLSAQDPERLVELGQLYWEQGQRARARKRTEDAIRRNPDLASAHALRGHLLMESGDLDAALASLHRSLTLQPNCPEVQLSIAEIHHRRDQPHRALATLTSAADFYPTHEVPARVVFLEGLVLSRLGRFQESLARFETLAANQPENVDYWFRLAETRFRLGMTPAARAAVERALQLSPEDTSSRLLLAQLDRGRTSLAAEVQPSRN